MNTDMDLHPDVVLLQEQHPDWIINVETFRGDTWVITAADKLLQLLSWLKQCPNGAYDSLSDIVGIDQLGRREHRFEVVYNMYSHFSLRRLFIRICLQLGAPVPSATGLYSGAEFPEREIYDMFGIEFTDHPDMRRILMPEDWIGHPLRKDFPLGGEEVVFDAGTVGPSIEEVQTPYPGSSYHGLTGASEREP